VIAARGTPGGTGFSTRSRDESGDQSPAVLWIKVAGTAGKSTKTSGNPQRRAPAIRSDGELAAALRTSPFISSGSLGASPGSRWITP
jgi:hypothetical protein